MKRRPDQNGKWCLAPISDIALCLALTQDDGWPIDAEGNMRELIGVVLAAAIALGGVSTAAAQGSGEAPGKKEPVKKERKVCKTFAKTSTRIGSDTICKTKSQWAADALSDAIAMERFKTENTGRPIVLNPGDPR
ncbi:MAG TPA: hypothetical protein VF782_13995 [Allosphingosinicella sp.]